MNSKKRSDKITNSSTDGSRCESRRASDIRSSTESDMRDIRNQGDMRDVTKSGKRDRLS